MWGKRAWCSFKIGAFPEFSDHSSRLSVAHDGMTWDIGQSKLSEI